MAHPLESRDLAFPLPEDCAGRVCAESGGGNFSKVMEEDRFTRNRREAGTQQASGWKPGGLHFLALALSFVLLILALVLGLTSGVGFIITVPLVLVALVIPVVMFLGYGRPRRIAGDCAFCGATVTTESHIAELDCPSCGKRIEWREGRFSGVA